MDERKHIMRKLITLIVDVWHVITGWEQCDERLSVHGEVHYCQLKRHHNGRCKTCFGREFN